ncbi:MAG: LAGLIDADG family homing endonuclease [Cetobacterium sp.]
MTVKEWLGEDNKLGYDIWNNKYRHNGESFDEWLDRLSNGNLEVRDLIKNKKFLYGGRILANLNTGTSQGVSNCVTLAYVEDSLEDIMKTATELAFSFKKEAGVGLALSKIRPKGAKIGEKGVSDGIIGFLKIFNEVTANISRGNSRRGAMLVGLHCDHPDIKDFITIKKGNEGANGLITSANISVMITDEFMEHYKKGENYRKDFIVESTGEIIEHIVNTKEIMELIADTPKTSFEPGILFVDRYQDGHLFGHTEGGKWMFNNACCFTGDMKLLTVDGYKRFKDIVDTNQYIYDKDGNISNSKIWSNGVKPVYKVRLFSDIEIKCTDDHVFLTTEGLEVQAKDLVGNKIMPNTNEVLAKDDWFVKLGFIQGDGGTGRLESIHHKGLEVYIGDNDKDVYDFFEIDKFVKSKNKNRGYYINFDMDKMRDLGVSSKPVWDRDFPSTYENWNKSEKASFLKGLFSANGYVLEKYNRIGIKTTSQSEAISILNTLKNDFDINAYITKNKSKKIKWNNGEYVSKESYDVNISAYSSRLKFSENINFIHKYKSTSLKNSLINQSPKIKSIKYIGHEEVFDFEEPNLHFGVVNGFVAHNSEFIGEKGTVCLLGSMNLLEFVREEIGTTWFDFDDFEKSVGVAITALDKAHDYGIGRNGLDLQNQRAKDHRGLGLGIMGLADMFMKLGVKYGSDESIRISDKIAKIMKDKAIETSKSLAIELGQPDGIKRDEEYLVKNRLPVTIGLRNNSLLSIAPSGSIATMLGISTGIEPVFRTSYMRKTQSLHDVDTYYEVYHKPVQDIIDRLGHKPDYCIDTRDVTPREKVDVISAWQKYVDLSISNTTNFASDAKVEDIRDLYVYGWEKGVKGLTVYVDGSIEGVLNDKKSEDVKITTELKRGVMDSIPDDTIYIPKKLVHGCGELKVMIGYSKDKNKVTDVYIVPKMGQGCSKNIIGQAVLISQVLRLGGDLKDIQKSVSGIDACTSYYGAKLRGKEVSKGTNCPSGLLNLVIETQESLTKVDDKVNNDGFSKCPECGEITLKNEASCVSCTSCGYSKCS